MNKLTIAGIIAVIAVFGVVLLMSVAANPTDNGNGQGLGNTPSPAKLPPIVNGKQDVFLRATGNGFYEPGNLLVKKGIPVRIHYSADIDAGCGREVIFPEFRVRKFAPTTGEAIIEFTPQRTGKFPFHCSMKMFRGTIEVVQ